MDSKKLIITIDGPSAAGKSTLGKRLAKELSYLYLDTGAMYRAIAWKVVNSGISKNDKQEVIRCSNNCNISFKWEKDAFHIFADEKDVNDEIREETIGEVASVISTIPQVRERLVELQRKLAQKGGVVLEGRDTGTVVCPQADVKFYLDASTGERGKRRYQDVRDKSEEADLEKITVELEQRDKRDVERKHSPLQIAKDAIYIDSTSLTIEEVLEVILRRVNEHLMNCQ